MVVVSPCPGITHRLFGQRQQFVVNGTQNLPPVAARKVGAADAVAEERVAGNQFTLGWNPQADASLRMSGSMEDVKFRGAHGQHRRRPWHR